MADKTWSQIETEISETFRKWRLDPPRLTYSIAKRSAAKRVQTKEERSITIEFRLRGKLARLTMAREERAIENLQRIAQAVELLRLAEVRTVQTLVMLLYRQLYPAEASAPPPPPRAEVPPSTGPYAVLHVSNNAPIEVCEAAYKALSRIYHPDVGGATTTMQRLNAAIEQIRKEKTR